MSPALVPRRTVLGSIAALPLAGAPAAAAVLSADAELLRLGTDFELAWEHEASCWRASTNAFSQEEGSRLGDVAEHAAGQTGKIVAAIERLPATTLAGVMVKVRACSHCHSGEPFDGTFLCEEGRTSTDVRLAEAVLRDLMAMHGGSVPVSS